MKVDREDYKRWISKVLSFVWRVHQQKRHDSSCYTCRLSEVSERESSIFTILLKKTEFSKQLMTVYAARLTVWPFLKPFSLRWCWWVPVQFNSINSFRQVYLHRLERFSNECRKTKTKVITPANHNEHTLPNEPIRTRSKYMQPTPSAGKRVRPSHDWFWFNLWLVEKVAREFLTNRRAN